MKFWKMLFTLFVLYPLLTVQAQGAPDAINAAVQDLNSRVGQTLTLAQLDNWRWEQQLFGDASLGCPQAGQTYAQVQTAGYIFTLVYRGTTYDYRVSTDQTIVILCQTLGAGAPTPTPDPATQYSNPLCPAPEVGKAPYMRTRLAPDLAGRVTSGLNRLRDQPSINAAQVGEMPNGVAFKVVAGPQCADEIVWWQVDYDGTVAWTAEGQAGEYFVEPFPPLALPPRDLITTANVAQVTFFAQAEGNFLARLAWSADSKTLALLGAIGSEALWLYAPDTLTQPPTLLEVPYGGLNDLALLSNNQQAFFTTTDGGAYLWNIQDDFTFREALFLKTHQEKTVIAINPAGTQFAAAGFNAATNVNIDKAYALVLWDIASVAQLAALPSAAQIIEMAYSPDGTKLVTVDTAGTVQIIPMTAPYTPVVLANVGARDAVFSPNGQFIALAKSSGIDLLDAATGQVIATYTGHLGTVNAVAFSPDNTLLASVSEDGTLRLWNTQTDTGVAVIEVGEKGAQDVAFAPGGDLLATVGIDRILRFYGVKKPL
jgi:hypothetical protein